MLFVVISSLSLPLDTSHNVSSVKLMTVSLSRHCFQEGSISVLSISVLLCAECWSVSHLLDGTQSCHKCWIHRTSTGCKGQADPGARKIGRTRWIDMLAVIDCCSDRLL